MKNRLQLMKADETKGVKPGQKYLYYLIPVLLAVSFVCMGMGGATGDPFGAGPRDSERFFRAKVVDHSNKSFEVQGLFVDGSTYLPARVGSAKAEVDFGKIRTARFYSQNDRVLARLTLVGQEEMDFYIQPGTIFRGMTDWGTVSFRADEIKEISFK
ncbi:hypothetical protein [Desulfonatronospira sp.]|uniref:hypothetical protein n=1 Tax=Desulfonatronospira sp. TaxID=1962951 RepID=UPI0025C6C7B7|nr:hypothetical protein [Desulfonatronospira sp.]